MIADLTRTEWIPAADVRAGDRVVDWHDEHGRSVFDFDPEARRVVERKETDGTVEFVLASDSGYRGRLFKIATAPVEVQR